MPITIEIDQNLVFLPRKTKEYKMSQNYEEILSKMYGAHLEDNYEKFHRQKEYSKKLKSRRRN